MLLSGNNGSAEESMTLLSVFMDHMLLQPFCQEFEGTPANMLPLYISHLVCTDLLESVLSSYSSADVDISMYARRLFFKLVRHQRFEKAFRLAVDISAPDLFMVIIVIITTIDHISSYIGSAWCCHSVQSIIIGGGLFEKENRN